jgi:hypothetical protein
VLELFGVRRHRLRLNALLFAPLGIVGAAPMAAGSYLVYSEMPGLMRQGHPASVDHFLHTVGAFGVTSVVTLLLYPLTMAAITQGAVQSLRGERARLGAMLAVGFRGYFRVLLMGLLVGLAMIPATLLLVFPAIVLGVGWSAAVPAAVAEGASPIRALGRSWDLTRGHRWRVFAVFLVVGLATALVAGLFQGTSMAIVLATRGPAGMAGPGIAVPMAIYQLVAGALGTVTMVTCAVAYHGLRGAKEGGDPVLLAQVFE